MNRVYLLWSGGLDSTFMIQHILENTDSIVHAGYVEVANNKVKMQHEQKAINKMVPVFKRMFGERFQYDGTVLKYSLYKRNESVLIQLAAWMGALMMTTNHDFDQVAIGYVMGDCAISYLSEMERLFDVYRDICNGHFPSVWFPLSKWHKDQIARTLDPRLKKRVFWCESPKKGKPCKECEPCKRSPLLNEKR